MCHAVLETAEIVEGMGVRFWLGSGEIDVSVGKTYQKVVDHVSKDLNAKLGDLYEPDSVEICYMPIIMGPQFEGLYTARYTQYEGELQVFLSPELDYRVFRKGSLSSMIREYTRGLHDSLPHAAKLLEAEIIEKLRMIVTHHGNCLIAALEGGENQ